MMLIVNSIDNVCSRVVGLVFLLKVIIRMRLKGGGCHDVMMLIVNSIDNVCSRVVGLVFLLKAAK